MASDFELRLMGRCSSWVPSVERRERARTRSRAEAVGGARDSRHPGRAGRRREPGALRVETLRPREPRELLAPRVHRAREPQPLLGGPEPRRAVVPQARALLLLELEERD